MNLPKAPDVDSKEAKRLLDEAIRVLVEQVKRTNPLFHLLGDKG